MLLILKLLWSLGHECSWIQQGKWPGISGFLSPYHYHFYMKWILPFFTPMWWLGWSFALEVWLLSPVTRGLHVRANIHMWIPRETTVNCTTLTSSLLSQATHGPHWRTNQAQMPCLHIQGSQSLGLNLMSPSPHPWNWGLVRFYSLVPLSGWCNVMETLVGWFLCPFWVLPFASLTRQYFIFANVGSHNHFRAQGYRIVFPRGEHGSCTGALSEGPFSPCSSSLVTVSSLEVTVKSPSSCLLL